MSENKRLCFFIMPFEPELNYFFLYLKHYIEEKYPSLECKRADTSGRLGEIVDEIRFDIQRAYVIIADCTGNNPNVFYELGIAQAHKKQVSLITQDIDGVPFDVTGLRFIPYRLDGEVEFLAELDEALTYVLSQRFVEYYAYAMDAFKQFKQDSELAIEAITIEVFQESLEKEEARGNPAPSITREHDSVKIARLLPLIIKDIDSNIIDQIHKWLRP